MPNRVVFIKVRNSFQRAEIYAKIGSNAFGFTWTAWVLLLFSIINLFYRNLRSDETACSSRLAARRPSEIRGFQGLMRRMQKNKPVKSPNVEKITYPGENTIIA